MLVFQHQEKGIQMDTIERIIQLTLQAAIAFIVVFFCVRLCTGCTLIQKAAPKEKIVETIKTADAEGGREAVSNKIEKLVVSGDLSRKQADKIHVLAQGLYDHVIEKLSAEDIETCIECKDE